MKTSIRDFKFTQTGYGRYDVTYTSPKTGRTYSCTVTDMILIDATKNEDDPRQADLIELKRRCKLGQQFANSLK